jgi:hypothetical protein
MYLETWSSLSTFLLPLALELLRLLLKLESS